MLPQTTRRGVSKTKVNSNSLSQDNLYFHPWQIFDVGFNEIDIALVAFVLVDSRAMLNVDKFWIPQKVHFKSEQEIQEYIRNTFFKGDKKQNTANNLRFGLAPKKTPGQHFDELYISRGLLGDEEGGQVSFPMYAEACSTVAETMAALKAMGIKDTVCDYNRPSWGVKGSKV